MPDQPLYNEHIDLNHLIFFEGKGSSVKRPVDFAEVCFDKYAKLKVRKILDLGSGSGELAIEMSKRGYSVTGLDLSSSAVKYASEAARIGNVPRISFTQKDMRTINLRNEFQAVTCFNSVLGLLDTHQDLIDVLRRIRNALTKGGLLVADVINPYAWLLREKRNSSSKLTSKGEVYMTSNTGFNNLVLPEITVSATIFLRERGSNLKMILHDETLQGFTARELHLMAQSVGFRDVRIFGDFANSENPKRAFWLNLVATK